MPDNKNPFLNASGCPDPTAYHAIKNVTKAENELDTKVNFLIKVLKYIIAESGFELLARIELREVLSMRACRTGLRPLALVPGKWEPRNAGMTRP